MELSEFAVFFRSLVYVKPSNNSIFSPFFLSSYVSILYSIAFLTSVFFAIKRSESYSRFITVRALSGKYILTGFIMMVISSNISTSEQAEIAQHVYLAYALINFVIIRHIKNVHLKYSSHYNKIYFIAIIGLWINILLQIVLWIKLAILDWNYDCIIGEVILPCEWYNYVYSVTSNLVTVVIVSVIYIDYAKILKKYFSKKPQIINLKGGK